MNLIAWISPYTIAILIAWVGAHAIKYIVCKIKDKDASCKSSMFASGGMPSAHTATMISLTTVIGLCDGFESGLFGLASLLSLIVMHDAMRVRRATGEQGTAIEALIKEQKSKVKVPYSANGHLLKEVVAGFILGLLIGIVVFLATK